MRKKQISAVLLVVMVFAIVSPMIRIAQTSPQTILEVYPETTTVDVGETFTVYVNITDVVDLAGYEFKLAYNRYILEVVDVTNGTFFDDALIHLDCVFTGQPTDDADVVEDGILDIYDWVFMVGHWYDPPVIGPCGYDSRADLNDDGFVDIWDGSILNAAYWNTYEEMPGTIHSLFYAVPGVAPPESGSGSLVTITFRAIGFGVTVLDLYRSKLSLICGEPIPHETRDGTVTVLVPTPDEAVQNLADVVESMNLEQGIDNSLDAKLENVLASIEALNAGQRNDAINKLDAFMNAVEAQRGNKITDEQADYLLASTQAIINAIG